MILPGVKWYNSESRAGDYTLVLRPSASGTPSADFWCVPHTGESFVILAIDLNTIQGDQLVQVYHVEDWAGAIGQLKA